MMRNLKNIFVISRFTFIELYKSRILVNVLFLSFAIVLISFVASELAYGTKTKVALDFGLGCVSISVIGIAIFMGVNLIQKEIEFRTIHMILSRPIKRTSFILGKIFGMSAILFINVFILGLVSIAFFKFLGGELNSLIIWAIFFSYLEGVILLLIAVLFSLMTNTVLSVIYTIIIYVLGHAMNESLSLPMVQESPLFLSLVKFYSYIFPNLSKFNVKDFVLYKQFLPSDFLWGAGLYGLSYGLVLLLISIMIFQRKNLD